MLWYGYIYYILFNTFLITSVVFLLRVYILNAANQINILVNLSRVFLASVLFVFFITFTSLHCLLDYYQDLLLFNSSSVNLSLLTNYRDAHLLSANAISLSLVQVYYYPFIYVFLIVTVLSIVFCLSYNTDELFSFMFYCLTILSAGYVLFFTDSIILFFLAYEMLLVPSFFILYKFAKTRRCVEAAYLMFFWTQFGALFLIFALLYLFFVSGSSQFSVITYFYFTPFEVNFLFLCLLFGFGVKLPI